MSHCVSLAGSKTCPAFGALSIDAGNGTLRQAYTFFNDVTDVASFDSRFNTFLTSLGPGSFKDVKIVGGLGCDESAPIDTSALPYAQTVLCGIFAGRSFSGACYTSPTAGTTSTCESTCQVFNNAESALARNVGVCHGQGLTVAANRTIVNDFLACTTRGSTSNAPLGQCIAGEANEPNCGLRNNTHSLCQLCDPSQGTVGACCTANTTDLSSCSYAAAVSRSSNANSSPTSGARSPSAGGHNTGHHGLSKGAIAGIAVGSAIAALLLLAALALCGYRAHKKRRAEWRRRNPTMEDLYGDKSGNARATQPYGTAQKDDGSGTGLRARDSSDNVSNTYNEHLKDIQLNDREWSSKRKTAAVGAAGAAGIAGVAAARRTGRSAEGHSSPSSDEDEAPAARAARTDDPRSRNMSDATVRQRNGAAAARLGAANYAAPNRETSTSTDQGSSSDGSRNQLHSWCDEHSGQMIYRGSIVRPVYSYEAQLRDEMSLGGNAEIEITKLFDDGWAVGRRATGERGAFPLVCVTAKFEPGQGGQRRAAGDGLASRQMFDTSDSSIDRTARGRAHSTSETDTTDDERSRGAGGPALDHPTTDEEAPNYVTSSSSPQPNSASVPNARTEHLRSGEPSHVSSSDGETSFHTLV